MTARKQPTYELGPGSDVDLEIEDIRDSRGRRITEEYVEAVVVDTHRKLGRGRPSLTGAPSRSPQVTFRLPSELRAQAERLAEHEGKRVSEVAREALEDYLTRHRVS